jgi:hypothetical protein
MLDWIVQVALGLMLMDLGLKIAATQTAPLNG